MDVASCADIEILENTKDKYINSSSIMTDGIKHVITIMETAISKK